MITEAFVIRLFFTTKQKTHRVRNKTFKFLCPPALERKHCHEVSMELPLFTESDCSDHEIFD